MTQVKRRRVDALHTNSELTAKEIIKLKYMLTILLILIIHLKEIYLSAFNKNKNLSIYLYF